MNNDTRNNRGAFRALGTIIAAALLITTASCANPGASSTSTEPVTIEFAQWWEPELPTGALRGIINEFETTNPGIKVNLLSGPYASTKEQLFAGAAAATMSDVVGLDGSWVSDFVKQSAIANLTELMSKANFSDSQLASQIKINGSTYMIPAVNFIYPMFTNDEILAKAGVTAPPSTRTQFKTAAKAITALGNNTSGWILPLSQETPNGVQNDVMAWVWASGGSMLQHDKPNLTGANIKSAIEFVQDVWKDGSIATGSFTMKEQDKVEEFGNGRVGMMIDSLAHVNLLRKNNPNLKFSISAIPATDGFTGQRGIPYASWGLGISAASKHPAESFKLIEYLMSEPVNSKLSTLANAFPGNTASKPDFSASDPLFQTAFEIYKNGKPANEFTGLPVAEDLMRSFDLQLQRLLNGDQSINTTLENTQKDWLTKF